MERGSDSPNRKFGTQGAGPAARPQKNNDPWILLLGRRELRLSGTVGRCRPSLAAFLHNRLMYAVSSPVLLFHVAVEQGGEETRSTTRRQSSRSRRSTRRTRARRKVMMAVMRRGQQQKRPQKKKCKLVDVIAIVLYYSPFYSPIVL
jgi:hypothetical protein